MTNQVHQPQHAPPRCFPHSQTPSGIETSEPKKTLKEYECRELAREQDFCVHHRVWVATTFQAHLNSLGRFKLKVPELLHDGVNCSRREVLAVSCLLEGKLSPSNFCERDERRQAQAVRNGGDTHHLLCRRMRTRR